MRINARITLAGGPPRLEVNVPSSHIKIPDNPREGYTVTVLLSPAAVEKLRQEVNTWTS